MNLYYIAGGKNTYLFEFEDVASKEKLRA